jgi:tripartite-type tricarboxylate transporter receptor subunit TctC
LNLLTRTTMFAAMLWLAASQALAQNYPSKLIRIVVPFAPGGVTDVVARITADYIGRKTGQQVIVENRSGAGGNVGTDAVAKAEPDGYTLVLVNTANIVINPFLYKHMPFDALKDLVAIAPVGEAPQLLIVNTGVPVRTLQELITLAKAQPGKISYGSAGSGSTAHLGSDRFARLAGVELLHVPYRGMGPAIGDLVSGNIHVISLSAGPVIELVKSGKLRVLAAATKTRLPYFPDVPTSGEAGLPGYEMTTWFALFAPKGTPQDIVDALNGHVRAMYSDPVAKGRLETHFLAPMPISAAEFAHLIQAEYKTWERVVSESGLQPQ